MAVDREALARVLRDARQNAGMSQHAAANRIGLSRTVLAQIELGNRPVSQDELSKLANAYRRSVSDFLPTAEVDEGDVVARVFNVKPSLPARLRPALEEVVNLCREAAALERVLGRPTRMGPPQYGVARPRNTADAIVQGEQVADQERQRLGLGPGSPIANISDLVVPQGVRVAVATLPEEVLGIFIRHRSIGSLIIARRDEIASGGGDVWSLRFGLLHSYALALFETDQPVLVTTLDSSDELSEIRANAFAAAFLLPRSGLESSIASLDKGRPSRRALAVFGIAAEEAAEVVVRSAPRSQTLTCHDIAIIAGRFGASYEATVHRLRSLDLISKPETAELLRDEAHRAAAATTRILLANGDRRHLSAFDEMMPLKSEVALLGIEAYRRDLLAKGDLTALATKLKLPALTPARLLELAEASR